MTEKKVDTPCFVLDVDKLRDNIRSFRYAMNSRFRNGIIGYSVKTNSLPALLKYVQEEGCFAEVVSYDEYNLATSLGFNPDHIIYNGPMKDKKTFLHAIMGGAVVNIDTKRELDWLKELPSEGLFSIGLRVNLNLMDISPEDCKEKELYSRFGFSINNNEFEEALRRIRECDNVKLAGLHLHRTSKTRSLQVYTNICLYAIKAIERYDLRVDYLDLGGGFYGDMPGKPTYQDYINTIADVLSEKFDINKIKLIVEPGNAIIASPISYYMSAIDSKIVGNHRIIVTDGSRNDVDPFFHKTDYFKSIIRLNENYEVIENQVFVGCTCLENDILFELTKAPRCDIGDLIVFSYVGAYTSSLSPLFIRYFPRVYIYEAGEYSLVRKEWTEKEFLQ